jgi:cytochrome c biogenesis protein CcmG, thiol:disulfide interchange protein DsbE
LRGQIVLLNFWATWCGPCRVEMPEFEKAYQQNSDQGFTILAINNQETKEDVAGFRDELGLSFPIVMDETGALQKQYGVFSYPSTYVIDRKGVIIARQFGPLTAKQINELVTKALT